MSRRSGIAGWCCWRTAPGPPPAAGDAEDPPASEGWQHGGHLYHPFRPAEYQTMQLERLAATLAADVQAAAPAEEKPEGSTAMCARSAAMYTRGLLPEDYKCPLCGAGAGVFQAGVVKSAFLHEKNSRMVIPSCCSYHHSTEEASTGQPPQVPPPAPSTAPW